MPEEALRPSGEKVVDRPDEGVQRSADPSSPLSRTFSPKGRRTFFGKSSGCHIKSGSSSICGTSTRPLSVIRISGMTDSGIRLNPM